MYVRCYNINTGLKDVKGSVSFRQRVYYKINSVIKLVHYIGDESSYFPHHHGNDKFENPREYRRTLPPVLESVKGRGIDHEPNVIYKEMVVTLQLAYNLEGVIHGISIFPI